LKLYILLSRYSDNTTAEAWPSRALLAEELGYKQTRSVDPLIAELEAAGAITVIRQTRPGSKENAVNRYRVHRHGDIAPVRGSAKKRTTPPEEVVQKNAPRSAMKRPTVVQSDAQELITNELITNELRSSAPADAETGQGALVDVTPVKTPDQILTEQAQYVARTLVERHPAMNFKAMMVMAKKMMKAYAVDAPTVGRTMENIYMSGRGSVTDQRVGQVLEGIVSAAGSAPIIDRKMEKIRNTLTMPLNPGTPAAPALTTINPADLYPLRITS
jgi:hypothetical protein